MPSDQSEEIVPRTALRLVTLSEIVLYKLYRAHIEDDTKDAYTFEDIQQMLAHQVSRKMVLAALKLLNTQDRGKSSINRSRKAGEYQYAISTEGIFQIERALNRGNSVATYLNRHPDATLDEVAGFDGLFFTQDERFEADVWKPLPIDRNRDAFKKALRDVEDAYDAIRSDNGFASEFPEIRNSIVDDLNTGIEKLKKEKPQ